MGITPETHVRAARELLRWDQGRLATAAGVSLITIKRFETGVGVVSERSVEKILAALRDAGILFLEASVVLGETITGGVATKPGAAPEPPPETRKYKYRTKAGRPKAGKEEGDEPDAT